ENDGTDILERPEFAGLFERQIASAGIHRPNGNSRIAALENAGQGGRYDAERRNAILRIPRLDLFLEDADSRDARRLRCELDGLLDAIGEVVELAVRIPGPRPALKGLVHSRARFDHDGIPHVGMDVCALRKLLPHALDGARPVARLPGRGRANNRCTSPV